MYAGSPRGGVTPSVVNTTRAIVAGVMLAAVVASGQEERGSTLPASAAVGMDYGQVLAALGSPAGRTPVSKGGVQVLTYPDMEIILRDGRVARINRKEHRAPRVSTAPSGETPATQGMPPDAPKQDDRDRAEASVLAYRVVGTEDISIKALSGPLSSHSVAEVSKAPRNTRKVYRIIVPSSISREDLVACMKDVVQKATAGDPEIDEVTVFAYDRVEDSNGAYTFGRMDWCPATGWTGVTPRIALTNDRSSYQYDYRVSDKVGNLERADVPTRAEFMMYDLLDRALTDYPDTDEEVLLRWAARKLGTTPAQVDKAWLKVLTYKMK